MGLVELIIAVALGALVGWVASIIMRTEAEQGAVMNVVVGVIGAFLGNVLSRLITGAPQAGLGLNVVSLLWALLGAVVLLALYNLVTKRRIR